MTGLTTDGRDELVVLSNSCPLENKLAVPLMVWVILVLFVCCGLELFNCCVCHLDDDTVISQSVVDAFYCVSAAVFDAALCSCCLIRSLPPIADRLAHRQHRRVTSCAGNGCSNLCPLL